MTPGQAAYEAKCAAVRKRRGPEFFVVGWDDLPDGDQDEWEAAVQAGSQQQYLYLRERIDRLTAVAADMLSRFGPSGSGHTARVGQVQIAKWRKAAGLEG